jgi:hypothetical protein
VIFDRHAVATLVVILGNQLQNRERILIDPETIREKIRGFTFSDAAVLAEIYHEGNPTCYSVFAEITRLEALASVGERVSERPLSQVKTEI